MSVVLIFACVMPSAGLIEIRAFFPNNTPLSADVNSLDLLGSFFVLSIRTFPTSSSITVATEESVSSPTQLRVENSGPEVLSGLTVESLFPIPSDKAILEVIASSSLPPSSLFHDGVQKNTYIHSVCILNRSIARRLLEPRLWTWALAWTHSHQQTST